jgi:FkbM family methyltransferase
MTAEVAVSVAGALVAAVAMAVAMRSWRRLKIIRLEFDRAKRQGGLVAEELLALTRQTLLMRYRQLAGDGVTPLPLRSCSQHGEDALIWALCGEKTTGYFVEVGAYDGVSLSNSYFFEAIGWTGLLVEAHPDLYSRCRNARPGSRVVHAALGKAGADGSVAFHAVSGGQGIDSLSYTVTDDEHTRRIVREGGSARIVEVPLTSLDALLGVDPPTTIDFVSVDVEGAEMDVLQGLDLDRWRPRILVVEDNSEGRDDRVSRYLGRFGYRRIARRGCNDFFSA